MGTEATGRAASAAFFARSSISRVRSRLPSRSTSDSRSETRLPSGFLNTTSRPSTCQGPAVSMRAPSLVTSQSAAAG